MDEPNASQPQRHPALSFGLRPSHHGGVWLPKSDMQKVGRSGAVLPPGGIRSYIDATTIDFSTRASATSTTPVDATRNSGGCCLWPRKTHSVCRRETFFSFHWYDDLLLLCAASSRLYAMLEVLPLSASFSLAPFWYLCFCLTFFWKKS